MPKKREPHRSITFRAPVAVYELLRRVAELRNCDMSAVMNDSLTKLLPELQMELTLHEHNVGPVPVVRRQLVATLGRENAEAVMRMASLIATGGPADEALSPMEHAERLAAELRRKSKEFTLAPAQLLVQGQQAHGAITALRALADRGARARAKGDKEVSS